MKRASQLTRDELEAILREQVDWDHVHRLYALRDYGEQIHVHSDGTVSLLGSNEHYRHPDAAGVIFTLRAAGAGNIDLTYYSEGWVERTEDGDFVVTETGERLDEADMIVQAIAEGEHDYNDWIDDALRQFDEGQV